MDPKELSQIKHSVERLENHFKVYKDDMLDVKDAIKDLKLAIIGNHVNGNKGFLHLLDKISEKVDAIEDENILLKEHMRTGKFIAGVLITALIGFMFMLITQK
jgi:hypothetical protein